MRDRVLKWLDTLEANRAAAVFRTVHAADPVDLDANDVSDDAHVEDLVDDAHEIGRTDR